MTHTAGLTWASNEEDHRDAYISTAGVRASWVTDMARGYRWLGQPYLVYPHLVYPRRPPPPTMVMFPPQAPHFKSPLNKYRRLSSVRFIQPSREFPNR